MRGLAKQPTDQLWAAGGSDPLHLHLRLMAQVPRYAGLSAGAGILPAPAEPGEMATSWQGAS
jgi:hypothetical protein